MNPGARADRPPSLRQALDAAGLRADKRFGQHFLLDLNVCRKITKLAEVSGESDVLEIGPGPGGLTRALLETGARVAAVERDERFLPILAELSQAFPARLRVINTDAITLEESHVLGPQAMVVANLPYNIASVLLLKWLTGPWRPPSMTLMFQAEVARRIVAGPGESDYGRLSVIAQALTDARIVMRLPARAFTPPPKVASAVVRLERLAEAPPDALITTLQRVTAAAFGQRRKMLRSSLRSLGGADLCTAAGIDPDARAETVPVLGFLDLARLTASLGRSAAAPGPRASDFGPA